MLSPPFAHFLSPLLLPFARFCLPLALFFSSLLSPLRSLSCCALCASGFAPAWRTVRFEFGVACSLLLRFPCARHSQVRALSRLSFFSRLLTVTLGVTPLYTDCNNQFIQGRAKDNRAQQQHATANTQRHSGGRWKFRNSVNRTESALNARPSCGCRQRAHC